jgi:excisionase family DNA binding protein
MTKRDTQPDLHPLAVSVPTSARLMGKGVRSVWQAIAQGEIAYIRDGRRVLIPVKGIEEYLLKRTVQPVSATDIATQILSGKQTTNGLRSKAHQARYPGGINHK